MEKLLVIGLGGSGGKTLAFLMDELKFRLGEHFADGLPDCWEFVHIDVPRQPDTQGKKLAEPVDKQGGTYIGLGPTSYLDVDAAVVSKLSSATPSALEKLAVWRPEKHEASKIPISLGAGAYRAIGRMATISRAEHIHSQLSQAMYRLSKSQDLGKLESFSGGPLTGSSNAVRVLMVSSLAGGSGASMVLDVADLLRALDFDGLDATHSVAFLYTGDVFGPEKAPTAGAGSLASISELINSLKNNDAWSSSDWAGMGASGLQKPTSSGRGPFMIFPIGSASHGVPFGDEPEDVYRGFARIMAPIMYNHDVQNSFWAYSITNALNDANNNPDNSRISETASTGTLNTTTWAHFGGYGSSTLTMGRERYLEYASQRLARETVELLVNGHGVGTNSDVNADQRKRELATELKESFLSKLPLGYNRGTGFAPEALISSASPKSTREGIVNNYLSDLGSVFGNQPAQAVAAKLKAKLTAYDQALSSGSDSVTQALRSWVESLQTSVEDAYLDAVSQYGLEVAGIILDELQSELTILASQTLAGSPLLSQNPPPAGAVAADVVSKLAKKGKEIVGPAAAAAVGAKKDIFGHFNFVITRQAGLSIKAALLDYVSNGLRPLKDNNQRLLRELVTELQMQGGGTVTAQYREASVSEWPKTGDNTVPSYFEPAVNEVMLESPSEFPKFFEDQIRQSVSSSQGSPLREAARQIILGMESDPNNPGEYRTITGWSLQRTDAGSHPHVGRTASWYPSEIIASIGGLSKSAGEYEIALGVGSLLSYSRNWIQRRDSAFERFGRQGFREWLNPMTGSSPDAALQKERRVLMESKIITALKYASPLVQIDEKMVVKIHGNQAIGLKFSFSTIPLADSDPLVDQMRKFWQATPVSSSNDDALDEALDPTSDGVREITIQSYFASPYVPLAFKSLTQPIRDEWTNAVSLDNRTSFWKWRRARPLRNFVPMAQKSIDAFVQGWLVGRISGHIQIDNNSYKPGYKKVRVWTEKSGWVDFASDPELLGVDGMGLSNNQPGFDNDGWNIPAILLENFSLAMAKCKGMDLTPLDPYWALVDMGLTLQKGDPQGNGLWGSVSKGLSPLQEYLSGSCSAQGVDGTQVEAIVGIGEPELRRNTAIEYVEQVLDYAKYLQNHNFDDQDFYNISRAYEYSPELQRACENLIVELRDLPINPSIQSSGGPRVPGA